MLNELPKSIEYSERAASIFMSVDDLLLNLKLKIETAHLYTRADRLDEAEELLLDVASRLEAIGETEHIGIASVAFAQLYVQKSDYEKALEFCRQASSLLPEQHLGQAKINRIRGLVAEALGDREEAAQRLHMAADEFKRLGEVSEWDDTMFELARLYEQDNDMTRTVHVLQEMRSFTKQILTQRSIAL